MAPEIATLKDSAQSQCAEVRGSPDSEQCLSGAAPDYPVPLEDKASNGRQLPNPNGWVTWLAHQTVSGGTPDCSVRPSTAATPNDCLVVEGYKYPQPPHSKHPSFPRFSFNTRASAFTPRHKSKESKPFQVPNPLQPLSDLRESFVRVLCALVAWFAFFHPHSCSQVNCNQSKRHQVCGGPCGV
jgi:hypothetical protein